MKNKIIIVLLVIGVIIIFMLLGMSAAGYFTKPKAVAQGIVCLLYTSPSPRDCS